MDLLQNPFHVLTANLRDDRRRIIELTEERSLLLDPSACMAACSNLTKPMIRLSAEIAWLPGIGPKRAAELLATLESSPMDLLAIDKLPSIARTNLLAAGLTRLPDYNADDLVDWILELAWEFEYIDPEELGVIINDDRIVSGFQEVSNLSAIETEIQERRKHYCKVIKSALDRLPPRDLVEVVTVAIETATDDGEKPCPALLSDLINSYDLEAQGFLEKEEENIKTIVTKLRAAVDAEKSDTVLTSMVDQLIRVVKNWDTVAQPIQVRAKSDGLDHEASHRVALLVRDLAIHMFNEHSKLDFSHKLTSMLKEVFAEVDELAELAAEDTETLGEIAEQRARLIRDAKKRAEKWQREITYEAEIGTILTNKLRISPEGIEWKGRRWDLGSITWIRWGGTQHFVNGVSSGTTYQIAFGHDSNSASINLNKQIVYNTFVECLWKAVGVCLLTEFLEGLRDAKSYRFRSAIVSDHGMELKHKNFWGGKKNVMWPLEELKIRYERFWASDDYVFCPWDDLTIWNDAGFFCIAKKNNKSLAVSLSYQDDDNTHILEAAIRMFWKRGGDRLSSLLEESAE